MSLHEPAGVPGPPVGRGRRAGKQPTAAGTEGTGGAWAVMLPRAITSAAAGAATAAMAGTIATATARTGSVALPTLGSPHPGLLPCTFMQFTQVLLWQDLGIPMARRTEPVPGRRVVPMPDRRVVPMPGRRVVPMPGRRVPRRGTGGTPLGGTGAGPSAGAVPSTPRRRRASVAAPALNLM
ncbi:hypothetical protein PLESTB_000949400 [Pleodorina starrii]|uniref:Uncharacterized protein n=1 Tax=Pleodorina starrii TaxID=330485 RepID=A0A9W6BMU1_9CHLO|nr:hypothetical protein PLESTM_001149400 [Pleodorina starrii]GLC55151.1 hypothetical protein PLESTB_000949400 [Pleodorina starrii]